MKEMKIKTVMRYITTMRMAYIKKMGNTNVGEDAMIHCQW